MKTKRLPTAVIVWALIMFVSAALTVFNVFSPQSDGDPASFEADSSVTQSVEVNGDSGFCITFIDVGQADSALVACDGHYMLIDGGNVADSDLIYTVLQKNGVSHLDYVVATHAHEDHVGGLSAALELCTVDTVYCSVTEYSSKAFTNFADKANKSGAPITVPKAGDSFTLGSATATVLAPLKTYDDTNNTSIVLKICYGETSFLFTGDAERDSEADMYESGADLSATLLKVGHHGSNTSSTYLFLREVMPQYAIISVGAGNSYGHPHEETLSRLRDAEVKVYRTGECGDIICRSDGKHLSFETQKKGQ